MISYWLLNIPTRYEGKYKEQCSQTRVKPLKYQGFSMVLYQNEDNPLDLHKYRYHQEILVIHCKITKREALLRYDTLSRCSEKVYADNAESIIMYLKMEDISEYLVSIISSNLF